MSPLPFQPDRRLTDVISENSFTVSAEVIPPRNGTEQSKVLTQIQSLVDAGAQFLAVTKGAGGSLRGGSLPIAQAIKEGFRVPCIAHFTCRDLTPMDVENQLMDHHYFGIRNILALRGDPPDGQKDWKAREGGYSYAYQLIEQIRKLNEGIYLPRENGPQASAQTPTEFCIGAAAYPDEPNESNRIEYFKLKIDHGAQFGITDMLFDPSSYARFLDQCGKKGIRVPILPGTRILKSQKQALRMIDKFKTHIPKALIEKLPEVETEDSINQGVEMFFELKDKLKAYGAPGIHLYVIVDTKSAVSALNRLASPAIQGKRIEHTYSEKAGVAK